MSQLFTVFADDLSGAAEIGGTSLRYGLTSAICVGNARPGGEQVSIRDLNTRSRAEEEVPSILADALESNAPAASGRLYKKVDSVLRGHVLIELTELIQQTGRRRALLVPVNPALGRIIHQGMYQINGVAIDKTEFRNDPQYPIFTSEVYKMLRPRPDLLPVTVAALGERLSGTGVIVGEAKAPEDLREWARRLDDDTLPAGGAAFFEAILREDGHHERETTCVAPAGSQLLVSGSAAESSSVNIRRLRERGVPVLAMPDDVFEGEEIPSQALQPWIRETITAVERSPLVAITIGRPLSIDRRRAPFLTARLAGLVKSVLGSSSIAQIWIEGGETASAVVNAVGWHRLTVCGQIEGRVFQLVPEGASTPLLKLKPGSYPWPEEVPVLGAEPDGGKKG
ncbi:MAG: hypothetical protein EHM18_11755 [Acidobacteria bacterium]|nr:MAG: hypothetical protein EHM18_11755 [Acidobacteriota bacterium]